MKHVKDPQGREDFYTMLRIIQRAELECIVSGAGDDRLTNLMDLETVHAKTPLDLARMEKASIADLTHDLLGIRRHLNRETGMLEDCFLPRFALRRAAPERRALKGRRASDHAETLEAADRRAGPRRFMG